MRRLLFFLLFLSFLSAGVFVSSASRYRDVYRTVCDLTEEHYYKTDPRFLSWLDECRARANKLPWRAGERVMMDSVQELMNTLGVSHFMIYDANEDKRLWRGESVDTGIRSRYVEELLIVYRVEKGSAGEEAGIRAGDEIIGLPGSDQVTPWGASRRTGRFMIKRRAVEMPFEVRARDLRIDSAPRLTDLGGGVALLELDSFRAEFFRKADWRKMVARLDSYPRLIVDVRENAGGSFVAMLRALSTFRCGGYSAGQIVQPRKALASKEEFDDDDSDLHQIDELDKYHAIGLRTFEGYGCYRGKVTLLMGPETSSTAEIFADNMRGRARVWGQPTAGDVILAVWYDLARLGPGYSVSIPEAVYLTRDGRELEAVGVKPERELYHDVEVALKGLDTWVEIARKAN